LDALYTHYEVVLYFYNLEPLHFGTNLDSLPQLEPIKTTWNNGWEKRIIN